MSPNPLSYISKEKVAGGTELESPESLEGGKVAQAAAGYRDSEVRCGNCVHYTPPNSCDVVEGEIDPEGSSDRFERKGGRFDDMGDVSGDDLDD